MTNYKEIVLCFGKETAGYKYKIQNQKLELIASDFIDKNWNLDACKPITLVDTENEVIIQKNKKKWVFDYETIQEVLTLILIMNNNFIGNSPLKIVEIEEMETKNV